MATATWHALKMELAPYLQSRVTISSTAHRKQILKMPVLFRLDNEIKDFDKTINHQFILDGLEASN